MSDMFPEGLPPIEPPANFRQGAIMNRQMFLAYTEAGFTEEQAMRILLTMIAASFGRGTGQ